MLQIALRPNCKIFSRKVEIVKFNFYKPVVLLLRREYTCAKWQNKKALFKQTK